MGCSLKKQKLEYGQPTNNTYYLIYKRHSTQQTIQEYDPNNKEKQFNVLLNGLLFQVLNPIEEIKDERINQEIE